MASTIALTLSDFWTFACERLAETSLLEWVLCFAPILVFLEIPRYFLPPFLLMLQGRRPGPPRKSGGLRGSPLVTVIIAGRNEGKVIESSIRSILDQDYEDLDVIVVDDNSFDQTASIARRYARSGSIRFIKNHGVRGRTGKPGACNLALRLARGEIVVALDADTVFDRHLVSMLVAEFSDPTVGVVAGNVTPRNWDKNLLTRLQTLEYSLGIELYKRWKDQSGAVVQASGAVAAFRRSALNQIGGWDPELAEDTDVSLRMFRAGWRIAFAPEAVALTEVPAHPSDLARQRARWDRGGLQTFFLKHARLLRPSVSGWVFCRELWAQTLFFLIGTLAYPIYLVYLATQGAFLFAFVLSVSFLFYSLISLSTLIPVNRICTVSVPPRALIGAALAMPFYKEGLRWVRLGAFIKEFLAFGSDDPFLPQTAWSEVGRSRSRVHSKAGAVRTPAKPSPIPKNT